METPRNLREMIDCIVRMQGGMDSLHEEIDALKTSYEALKTAQDRHLQVDRMPPPIPPFPKALEDIGLRPPSKRRTAT